MAAGLDPALTLCLGPGHHFQQRVPLSGDKQERDPEADMRKTAPAISTGCAGQLGPVRGEL